MENTVGKGKIAHYKQFLLFPQCFQNAYFPEASKGVIVWEWVNPFQNKPWFLHVCSTSLLKTLWEKEKLLVTSNFSFSPVFSTHSEDFLPFSSNFKLSSANSFSLEVSKVNASIKDLHDLITACIMTQNYSLTGRNFQNSEKFWPMSACI